MISVSHSHNRINDWLTLKLAALTREEVIKYKYDETCDEKKKIDHKNL